MISLKEQTTCGIQVSVEFFVRASLHSIHMFGETEILIE